MVESLVGAFLFVQSAPYSLLNSILFFILANIVLLPFSFPLFPRI